jgi:hypothetical protein
MADRPLGVVFRETMAGAFALGESDPLAGRAAGRRGGTELVLHAEVSIPDLGRFVADPDHLGGLAGTVDFAPFGAPVGSALAGHAGVFNLFRPEGEPGVKLMVYEVAFRHGGRDWYLAGRKEVQDDPGLDLWADTTTLFTRLHEGTDATGPVAGAGILRLGVGELIRLLTTVRVTGDGPAAEKVETVARFGRFFLGELWGSYGRYVRSGG